MNNFQATLNFKNIIIIILVTIIAAIFSYIFSTYMHDFKKPDVFIATYVTQVDDFKGSYELNSRFNLLKDKYNSINYLLSVKPSDLKELIQFYDFFDDIPESIPSMELFGNNEIVKYKSIIEYNAKKLLDYQNGNNKLINFKNYFDEYSNLIVSITGYSKSAVMKGMVAILESSINQYQSRKKISLDNFNYYFNEKFNIKYAAINNMDNVQFTRIKQQMKKEIEDLDTQISIAKELNFLDPTYDLSIVNNPNRFFSTDNFHMGYKALNLIKIKLIAQLESEISLQLESAYQKKKLFEEGLEEIKKTIPSIKAEFTFPKLNSVENNEIIIVMKNKSKLNNKNIFIFFTTIFFFIFSILIILGRNFFSNES